MSRAKKGGRNRDRAFLVLRAGLFLLAFAAMVLYMFLLRKLVYFGLVLPTRFDRWIGGGEEKVGFRACCVHAKSEWLKSAGFFGKWRKWGNGKMADFLIVHMCSQKREIYPLRRF